MNPALSSADSTEVKEIGGMIKLPATEKEMGREDMEMAVKESGEREPVLVLEFDLLLLFSTDFPRECDKEENLPLTEMLPQTTEVSF